MTTTNDSTPTLEEFRASLIDAIHEIGLDMALEFLADACGHIATDESITSADAWFEAADAISALASSPFVQALSE